MKKVNAGALQYVIFISIIVMLMLTVLLQFFSYQTSLKKRSFITKESYTQLQNSILTYIKKPVDKLKKTSYGLEEEFTFSTKPYGIFKILEATSQVNNVFNTQYALLGGGKEINEAIYLKDEFQPLTISGDAKIVGDVKLPVRGIKAGFVNGNYYHGNNLVFGNIKTSTKEIPYILNKVDFNNILKESLLNSFINIDTISNYTNSFSNSTQQIYNNGVLYLKGVTLGGNIIIRSAKKIIVEKTSILKEVILIAPEVEIKEGTKGSFQVFASEGINVEKNCELSYPSALVMLDDKDEFQINIAENTDIKGVLLYLSKSSSTNYKEINIHIPIGVTIYGEVYCEGNLFLEGVVKGSITTNYFIYKNLSSTYINMLNNGKVNLNEISEKYSGLMFDNSYKISKWLY